MSPIGSGNNSNINQETLREAFKTAAQQAASRTENSSSEIEPHDISHESDGDIPDAQDIIDAIKNRNQLPEGDADGSFDLPGLDDDTQIINCAYVIEPDHNPLDDTQNAILYQGEDGRNYDAEGNPVDLNDSVND